ncbi:CDP-glucose 4,6-dehydratase [Paenibacillus sp. LMG 31461]|uniref:CDP-glucose 4,6-dehydratase n=1 Tax=Paenibacillus plantarum TaxID=2654975 RepID=A0ABX1XI31_9BACL|nr:CDP-glucose 4,6-dehydratase [Paenibacillus plantarum]NOU67944.1 CDP-glucose 4,6-dehydratase [Paenibacillus plantarum]
MVNSAFWHGKRVLITGHSGFKGAWLCLWLQSLGADVIGYALQPPTEPNLFHLSGLDKDMQSFFADIRDRERLRQVVADTDPTIIFHMAAQPIVRNSYKNPVDTYEVNVMGTVNLLEAVRSAAASGKSSIRAVINVTTDKCYENREWSWGYREIDRLGGFDPYSNSKACSELVTSAFRSSFFHPDNGISIATARAGNVIGGGDWAEDRLIPDSIRAYLSNTVMNIRNPAAIRPWQHVLEPLGGYLLLAEHMVLDTGKYGDGWNFGPHDADVQNVEWVVQRLGSKLGTHDFYEIERGSDQVKHPHEANVLKLDCSKSASALNWRPKWSLDTTLDRITEWVHAYQEQLDTRSTCLKQIEAYMA